MIHNTAAPERTPCGCHGKPPVRRRGQRMGDIYSDAGVDSSYTGTQLSTVPANSFADPAAAGTVPNWAWLALTAVAAFVVFTSLDSGSRKRR
jgi:hypothetical protein